MIKDMINPFIIYLKNDTNMIKTVKDNEKVHQDYDKCNK